VRCIADEYYSSLRPLSDWRAEDEFPELGILSITADFDKIRVEV